MAAAPDLGRDRRFRRVEGDVSAGESFALRATVAYKGAWVRLVRSFGRAAPNDQAAARFGAAVAQVPGERGFDGCLGGLGEGWRCGRSVGTRLGVDVVGSKAAA